MACKSSEAVPFPLFAPTVVATNIDPTAYVMLVVPAIEFHCNCVVVPRLTIIYVLLTIKLPAVIVVPLGFAANTLADLNDSFD